MIKKNYDSEFCGSLPLHHINLIQPYGYLLVVHRADLSVIQASVNAADIFGQQVPDIIGRRLDNFIKPEEAEKLAAGFKAGGSEKIPVSLTVTLNGNAVSFVALVHAKSDYLVLEIERPEKESSFLTVYQDVKYAMAEISFASSVTEAGSVIVKELKKLSGFDKVLMYQFDGDWNGTVVAEEAEEGMASYLGLKFPASDIPKQARNLYLRNPYRLIPSREYEPVRLYPVINSVTHTFTDLSDCNLRAVANVHLEYMKNMEINASMSLRVMKNDQLWGLISCHHRTPMYLSYQACSAFELLSSVISNKITTIENREELLSVNALQEKRARLIEQIYADGDLINGLLNHDIKITTLLGAGGAAIFYQKKILTHGMVPDEEALEDLVYWLQSKGGDRVYSSINLAGEYEQAADFYETGSGMISIPVDASKGEYVLVFRPEAVKTVDWGGNPGEAIQFEEGGVKYHPRNSFRMWQETEKQTSLPWNKEELLAAENLRSFIFEFTVRSRYN